MSIFGTCGAGFDSLAGLVSAGFDAFGYSLFSGFGASFLGSSFLVYCLGSYFLAYCFGASPAGLALSGSISNKGFPTSKLSPALTWNFNNFPAWGLLISTVTLSVSTLATVSSCSTHSPYFFTNSVIVPSLIESAKKGKLMVLLAKKKTFFFIKSE